MTDNQMTDNQTPAGTAIGICLDIDGKLMGVMWKSHYFVEIIETLHDPGLLWSDGRHRPGITKHISHYSQLRRLLKSNPLRANWLHDLVHSTKMRALKASRRAAIE